MQQGDDLIKKRKQTKQKKMEMSFIIYDNFTKHSPEYSKLSFAWTTADQHSLSAQRKN